MRSTHLINSAFLSHKIIVDTPTDVRNAKHEHHFLKSDKINSHITLISNANVTKYSSLQLKANCIAFQRCLRHYFKHRTQRTQIFAVPTAPFRSKLKSNGLQIDHNRKFSERNFSTPAIFKATSKFFGSLGCSDDKN